MKHILVLTDFSEEANNALNYAFQLAKTHQASMTIYHAMREGDMVTFRLDQADEIEFIAVEQNIASKHFESWRNYTLDNDLKVSYVTTSGNILQEISMIVNQTKPDLIFMGNRGQDASKNIWGSTTSAVLDLVSTPLFVVSKNIDRIRFKNLIFASSFNIEEKQIFSQFLHIINPPKNATIHLLSVNTATFYNQPSSLIISAMKDFELLAYPLNVIKHQFIDFSVSKGLRRFYEENKADLLCLSHHKKNKIEKFFTYDVTKYILEHSTLPILIMPS